MSVLVVRVNVLFGVYFYDDQMQNDAKHDFAIFE